MTTFFFDVMGTLVYDPFYRDVPRHFGMSLNELIAAKDPRAWLEFELGQLTEAEFFARFFADGRLLDGPKFKQLMVDHYCFLDGAKTLAAELAARHGPLELVSNYSNWYHDIEAKLQLTEFANWTFVSCDEGLRKPDPAVFETLCAHSGVAPQDAVFVDDAVENCEAAAAFGMMTHRFVGMANLKSWLQNQGFLG